MSADNNNPSGNNSNKENNTSEGKPLNPPPSATTLRTVKKQRSRILGTPSSQVSLHTKFLKDQERPLLQPDTLPPDPAEAQSEQKPLPDNPSTVREDHQSPPASTSGETNAIPEHTPSPRRESLWSLWPRRSTVEQRPSLAPQQSSSAAASIKSAHSHKSSTSVKSEPAPDTSIPHSASEPETHTDNETSSINSQERQQHQQQSGWINWRKASFTSLRAAAGDDTSQTTDQVKAVASGNKSTAEVPKTTGKERTTSWSLWNSGNNTQPKERPSLSNILLSGGGEALLFEPTTNADQDPTKKPDKKPRIANRVVPEFEKSLPAYTATTSIINNINRLRYTLGFDVEDPKHLYRTSTPPKGIKKVLVIGVHGFFPTKVIRPLIGEPTGTSIKFANEAEKAIWRWAKRENIDIEVQKLALEKEGKIFERVEFFYEVMKKWKDDIDSADYIYFAAHSQGCPVSILLLSRLIDDGVISMQNKRISLLCMAGINNGPFYGVDQKLFVRAYSTIENNSLMELFQFQNFDSVHSREFLQALRTVTEHNVKITFVGSINDQLVPLYSSTCLHVRHPNIFRATYIDGSSKTPDFVSRTVSIANHLHNIGLSDHGVIKEISNSLAGPLTGGGHSKIYNDPQVYDLALGFSLYTSDLKYKIPMHFKPYVIEQLGTNSYHLPWCMRGLLFEARAHYQGANEEIERLFEEFEDWKPETKQLKDMKYRLNGIKSKL